MKLTHILFFLMLLASIVYCVTSDNKTEIEIDEGNVIGPGKPRSTHTTCPPGKTWNKAMKRCMTKSKT